MKSFGLFLISLAVVFATTADITTEEGVYVLTKDNFDKAITEFPYTLVEFYATWCGHCQQLAPHYAKAAQALAESNPDIKLAKVNAEDESDLSEKYQINGFPTLKFFIKGAEAPIDYTGGRTTEEIIKWVVKKSGAPTTEVKTVEEAEKIIKENDAVAIFFGAPSGNAFEIFQKNAQQYDEVVFINTESAEVRAKYGGADNFVVLLTNRGDDKAVFLGEFTADGIKSFVEKNRFPLVMEFNQQAAQRIFGEGLTALFLLVKNAEEGKAASETFRAVAKELKDKDTGLVFSIANFEEDFGARLADFLAVEESGLPVVRIVQATENLRKYVFDGQITAENLKTFIQDYNDKKLKPFFKSQDVPTEPLDNGVRVLVGKNWEEVVMDSTKDVLVEYYAPWCGHCQQLAPIYQKLANDLKGSANLIIAKMDSTENEVENVSIEGFPTIKFYPANNKQSPIDYDEGRTYDDFVSFLKKHATVPIVVAESKAEETKGEETKGDEKPVDIDL